ncbi:hypothetical protein E4U16_000971 [Claviceps sp. LM84 group G4]|nr:hypothetical protein E4U16_000971 [Claviceps sp. LM84 group G4]
MGPDFRPEWSRLEEIQPEDVSHLVDIAIQHWGDLLKGDNALHSGQVKRANRMDRQQAKQMQMLSRQHSYSPNLAQDSRDSRSSAGGDVRCGRYVSGSDYPSRVEREFLCLGGSVGPYLTMSRGSSPAQSEDAIWMSIVRLSRVSPDLHKKETRARPQREPPPSASNDCGIATGVLRKRRRGEGVDGDDDEPFKLSPHRDDSHGKKTALSMCDLASSPNASASGDRKRRRKTSQLCWFRV